MDKTKEKEIEEMKKYVILLLFLAIILTVVSVCTIIVLTYGIGK